MNAARLLVLVAALLGSVPAFADESFSCGQSIVTSEMTLGEITAKCGQPASRTSRTEDVRVRSQHTGGMAKVGETTIETLTWNRGSQAPAMVVIVIDGTVKSIERRQ